MSMSSTNILILGGGVGGLAVSSLLKQALGRRARITVVERKARFQFPPSYPWLMLGMRTPAQVEKSLSPLRRKGIDVVHDEVVSIDAAGKTVKTKGDSLAFDHLVVALGAELAPELVPGFREHAHSFYDAESALRAKEALDAFSGGDIAVGVSRAPFKCPAAPYEAALMLEDRLRKRGLGGKSHVSFFTPEGLPLPSAGPEIGNATLAFMTSRGIASKFKVKLTEVRPGEARFEDGSSLAFDLLLAVPPHRCPKPVVDAGLTDASGWVPVDPATMRTRLDDVYAIGDVAAVPTPSGFAPFLPKAGVFAHHQAEVVAHNLAVAVKGRGTRKAFDGGGACFLMTGAGQAAFVKGTWYAQPHPDIRFYPPSRTWYLQRVLFEKYWMRHWF